MSMNKFRVTPNGSTARPAWLDSRTTLTVVACHVNPVMELVQTSNSVLIRVSLAHRKIDLAIEDLGC